MRAMTATNQICPDCSAPYTLEDNYCRKCGMFVAALRTMTTADAHPASSRALQPVRGSLPVPVRRAATALVVGTVLQIGMSVAGKALARQAVRSVSSALTSQPKRAKRSRPASRAADPMADATVVSETLMIQRVWARRD